MILKKSNIYQIVFDSRKQTYGRAWYKERKLCLNASRFGQICKMRSTNCKNTVYNILFASESHSKYLQYGHNMEYIARKKAEQIIGEPIQACGLIIDSIVPYLAASPG